jgi:flagella basal body P-ring formation protein FlgA
MRTAVRLTAVGIALLLYAAAGGAQEAQLTVRSLVQPEGETIRMADVFHRAGRSGHDPAAPFPEADRVFGTRAGLIPLREIRRALGSETVQAPVLVGRRLHYIPPGMEQPQRLLARAVLTALDSTGGGRRLEIVPVRVPAAVEEYLRSSGRELAAPVSSPDGAGEPAVQAEPAERVDIEEAFGTGNGAGRGGRERGREMEAAYGRSIPAPEGERRFILRAEGRILGVCTVRVIPYLTVVTAPQRMGRGKVIEVGELPRSSVAVSELENRAARYPLSGRFRLERGVEQGEVLSTGVLSAEPAVKAASEVTVIMSRGSIQLRVDGRALEKGGVGDSVDVRLATGARVIANVTAPGVLEIAR